MENPAEKPQRIFKTAWFSKACAKALITDPELCTAIRQVMLGQCDNLGGGVYKKRLGKNLYRSIVVARGGKYWVYEYLYAKKNRDNIGSEELVRFRGLAKAYETLREQQVIELIQSKSWMEICYEQKA